MVPPKIKNFNNDVIVSIPDQGYTADVLKLNLPQIGNLPVVSLGFHPFRLVINMDIVDTSRQNTVTQKFIPPIEIRVHYTQADLAIASAARRNLCLGFWDGTRWMRFTSKKHHFHLEPNPNPINGGWCIISISHW